MTIAGIYNIRCAASASAVVENLCGVAKTGGFSDEVSLLNGCRLHTVSLTFKTATPPAVWQDAKVFMYTDADGLNHTISGDEDDYPVVTYQQENNQSTDPRYQVTVTMKY